MCSSGCLRLCLIAINIAFFLFGGGCLGVGTWLHFDSSSLTQLASGVGVSENQASLLTTAAYVLIIVGAITFLPALFGCCGAIAKHKLFLGMYIAVITVFLIIEIGLAIAFGVFHSKVDEKARAVLTKSQSRYQRGIDIDSSGKLTPATSAEDLAWDTVHIQFGCCGVNGSASFKLIASNWDNSYTISGVSINAKVPPSCCKIKDIPKSPTDLAAIEFVDLPNCMDQLVNTNDDACYNVFVVEIADNILILIAFAVAIVILEVTGIALACALIKEINKDD